MTQPQAPIALPLYGASFGQAVSRYVKKYATFSGRASRSEYWWVALFQAIVNVVLWILTLVLGAAGASIDASTGAAVPGPGFGVIVAIAGLWGLVNIVPELAIFWRRMHDTNRSGAFWFLGFIPFVGAIILLILTLLDSDPRGARFDAR